jgi:AraC-like DNA-binding protein
VRSVPANSYPIHAYSYEYVEYCFSALPSCDMASSTRQSANFMKKSIISEVYEFIDQRPTGQSFYFCQVPHIVIVHDQTSMKLQKQIYRPVFCLVLQGEKEVLVGKRRVVMRAGDALIVSHDLPVTTQVLEATREQPYIALVIELDIALVRDLYEEVSEAVPTRSPVNSVAVGQADDGLQDAMHRLLALHADPLQAKVLEPLIRREIHFRLLMTTHGGMLREMLRIDSHAGRIAKATREIQGRFREPLVVRELANLAGMSPSSFHEHFKAVTGCSPLQYQKAIRLIEAQQLLLEGTRSVSSVAFDVGYESPTQFSREYARKFGVSPREERKHAFAV